MRDEVIVKGIVCIVALVIIGAPVLWKVFAPQSGLTSRFGGDRIELERPSDCAKVINMGKSGDTKFLVYETNDGEVVMKEYSDWGVLEAEYVVPNE